MNDAHALYKLIILAMLDKAGFELTNSQITDFILEEQYTDYFTLQEVLSDMAESRLIEKKTVRNSTFYTMTESGRDTISYFKNNVSDAIHSDIQKYFEKNRLRMRSENAVTADYYRAGGGEFIAQMQVKEKDAVLVEISLTVPMERQAIALCDNWKKRSGQIYGYLMKELMQDET